MATPAKPFPTLSTARLTLRAPVSEDGSAYHAILSSPAVTRYSNLPDRPSKTQCDRILRWMTKLHPSGKGCAWIIERGDSKSVVGAIRFNSFDKKWRGGEVGYESHPDHWGAGFMTEALGAVVAWGHQVRRLNRVEAWTLPDNPASDRVLLKSGFRLEGVQRQKAWFKGAYHDFRLFGRVAADPISDGR